MKRFLLLLVFLGSFCFIKAQNLVPNYSFEDTIKCPIAYYQFNGYVSNWTGLEPGYFSPYCSDSPYGGMPLNSFGYQNAHTGKAYVGIYTFLRADTGSPNYTLYHNSRDYIQVQLSAPLIFAAKYYVTFYVSLADTEKYACNNIGAYLSDSTLNFSSRKVKSKLIPQIANDTSKNPLKSKSNWTEVSGSFFAKGGEQYIIIGNFTSDSLSDTVFENSSANYAIFTNSYYYIDDVIVSPDSNYADSLAGVTELKIKSEELKIYPNPSNGLFQLIISNEQLGIKSTIEVYNALGQKVYSQLSILNSQFSIDLSKQPSGIYLYRVITEDGDVVGTGKLIIN